MRRELANEQRVSEAGEGASCPATVGHFPEPSFEQVRVKGGPGSRGERQRQCRGEMHAVLPGLEIRQSGNSVNSGSSPPASPDSAPESQESPPQAQNLPNGIREHASSAHNRSPGDLTCDTLYVFTTGPVNSCSAEFQI